MDLKRLKRILHEGWSLEPPDALELIIRIEELEAWKASAMNVLGEWDAVHKALGSPSLGQSMAVTSLARVKELKDEIERLNTICDDDR